MTTSRTYDAKRRAEKQSRRWYKSPAWKVRRAQQLAEHPTCARCERDGVTRLAKVANHNPPHNEDYQQFFTGPLESACEHHHNSEIQSDEIRGFSTEIGADGWPIDEAHPSNSGAPQKKGVGGRERFRRAAAPAVPPSAPGAPSPRGRRPG